MSVSLVVVIKEKTKSYLRVRGEKQVVIAQGKVVITAQLAAEDGDFTRAMTTFHAKITYIIFPQL